VDTARALANRCWQAHSLADLGRRARAHRVISRSLCRSSSNQGTSGLVGCVTPNTRMIERLTGSALLHRGSQSAQRGNKRFTPSGSALSPRWKIRRGSMTAGNRSAPGTWRRPRALQAGNLVWGRSNLTIAAAGRSARCRLVTAGLGPAVAARRPAAASDPSRFSRASGRSLPRSRSSYLPVFAIRHQAHDR
jgi:hypothetical protein